MFVISQFNACVRAKALTESVVNAPLTEESRSNPKARSPGEIERLGHDLAAEAVRVVIGQISDAATRRTLWQVPKYGDDSGPRPSLALPNACYTRRTPTSPGPFYKP